MAPNKKTSNKSPPKDQEADGATEGPKRIQVNSYFVRLTGLEEFHGASASSEPTFAIPGDAL